MSDSHAEPDKSSDPLDSEELSNEGSDCSDNGADLLLRRYQLLNEIGTGAMGTVYRALDTKLQRQVAIKVLHQDRLSNDQITRLHREAKIIGQISHSSVVDVYDFDITPKNEPVMVMELIDGESLHDVLQRERGLPTADSLRIFIQICDAMEHAHKRGLIHRDLKPGNIMIAGEKAKILDFGMAKDATNQDATITRTGSIVGTPSSISPEQASGKEVDHKTDIYSMGCVMYETLTGRLPFGGDNTIETILKQVNEPAPPLKRPGSSKTYPSDLEDIVARALRKQPSERFESMDEMKIALQKVLSNYTGESIAEEKENKGSSSDKFSSLEAADGEPAVVRSQKLASGALVSKVVISFLVLGLIALVGFRIAGIDSATEEPKKEEPINFAKSRKNDQDWYQLVNPITADKIKSLYKEKNVTHLNLADTTFSTTQLGTLLKLPIDVIDLRRTKVTDETLNLLSQKPNLRGILLEGPAEITPRGFDYLRKLPDLRILALANTGINNKHVESISNIKTLRFIRLTRNPEITDAAVPYLISLPKLTSLAIGKTGIRKDGLFKLQRDMKLSYIGLKDHRLTDDEIPFLSHTLGLIDLNGNLITKKTIEKLCQLPELWWADVRNCPAVAGRDLVQLEDNLQDGSVWSDHNGTKTNDTADSEWYMEPNVYDLRWSDQALMFNVMEWQRHYARPDTDEHFLAP